MKKCKKEGPKCAAAASIGIERCKIRDLNTREELYSPLPWLLRPDDVAELCQVSTKTVLRAIRAGRLRAYRLGARGAYRIRPDDVEAWLQSCPVSRVERRAPVEVSVPPPQPRERGRLTLDGEVTRQ